MVPRYHAPPRSRCRILRLDHIQRSRRDRAIYCSGLYARDKSRRNDNVAGRPSSLHSLAGSVNLNYSLSPGITNVTIALNPSSLSLLTGAGASTMTVSGPASAPLNTYTITIGGTSGRLSHNVTSILRVVPPPSPDFSISAAPSSINVTRGSSTSSTITLTSIGGFAGTVNLSASISPSSGSSPTLALNPNRVTLLSGGTGNSVLTISTTGTTLLGVYTIVVLGVSGTLANSVSITLRVQ